MHITTADFNAWLDHLAPDMSLVAICTKANLSPSTISEQRTRGRVTPKTVIAIAEAFGANAVKELATFTGYEALVEREVTLVDAVPLYSTLDLLHEQFVRAGVAVPVTQFLLAPSDPFRRWFDMARGPIAQKDVAQAVAMQSSNLSRLIKEENLSLGKTLELAAYLSVHPVVALVAGGLISPDSAFSGGA